DLRRGGKLLDEDVTKIQRIYWIDSKPSSVRDVVAALGLTLRHKPGHIVAFMPEKLESELYRMERRYVENVLRVRPFVAKNVDETTSRVVPVARGGHRPERLSVTLKRE